MWMTLAVQVGLAVIGASIDYFVGDDDESEKDREPHSQPSIPMVSESDPIPVVFGRARLTGPNVTWYSGPSLAPRGSDKEQLKLGVQLVWCHGPVDWVARPQYGDRDLLLATGGATVSAIYRDIDGEKADVLFYPSDVGIAESLDHGPAFNGKVWFGMQTEAGGGYPMDEFNDGDAIDDDVGMGLGFRHVVSTAGYLYAGDDSSLAGVSIEVGRTDIRSHGDAQWYVDKASIDFEMNGAHIIRECLTDTMWGMGIPEAKIDDASFTAAADTLYSESLGLSGVLTRETPVVEFIKRVLEHIDGALFEEPTTGLYTLKLARDDYIIGELPVLNDSNCTINFTRPSPHELPTRVTVTYDDFDAGGELSYPLVNTPAYQDRGEINVTKNYSMIRTGHAAARVAARDLRQQSTPLARVRITEAHWSAAKDLRPTDLFVVQSNEKGIAQMVCRVATVDFGTTTNNAITVEALEDAFAYDDSVFTDPPDSGWEDPRNEPAPPASQFGLEPTLWMAHQADLEDDPHADQTDYTSRTTGYAALVAESPSEDTLGYDLYVEGATRENNVRFAPVLVTDSDLVQEASSVVGWTNDHQLDDSRQPVLQIGFELVIGQVGTVDNDAQTMTVDRGWGDTVPPALTYAAGTKMYLVGYVWSDAGNPSFERVHSLDRTARADGSSADMAALTETRLGQLPVSQATAETIVLDHRAIRPIAPRNVQITDNSDPVEFTGSVDLEWMHRNRFDEPLAEPQFTRQDLESGASYTVTVYGPDSSTGDEIQYHQEPNLTSRAWSYENSDEVLVYDGLAPWLRFEIEAKRTDGSTTYSSWQYQDRRLDR